MHEAWQLVTNAGIASLALGWTWTRDGLARGSALGALVTAGFVVAWLMRDFYGGAMAGTTTAAYSLLGLDAALVVMAAAATSFLAILVLEMRFRCPPRIRSRCLGFLRPSHAGIREKGRERESWSHPTYLTILIRKEPHE